MREGINHEGAKTIKPLLVGGVRDIGDNGTNANNVGGSIETVQGLVARARSTVTDLWARKIGFETLVHLHDILGTPMYDAVEKFQGIILEHATQPMAPRQIEEGEKEERSAIDDIKAILRKILNHVKRIFLKIWDVMQYGSFPD